MQFFLSWQFFAAVLVVFGWALYGLVGAMRQYRAVKPAAPSKQQTWRVAGYALFTGGPLLLAIPCLFKHLSIELAGIVVVVVLSLGVLDVLIGGFFLIAADRAES
jgi:hypothetical protein